MRICISSGHSTKCQGAVGILNEVEEATAVVDEVTNYLKDMGYAVEKFHDTVSKTQNENLNRIVDWHNSQGNRDYDVSVHFNASETHEGQGVEVFYYNEQKLAADISAAISNVSGLKNRGAKQNKGLFFLAHTAAPAVLLEICSFVLGNSGGVTGSAEETAFSSGMEQHVIFSFRFDRQLVAAEDGGDSFADQREVGAVFLGVPGVVHETYFEQDRRSRGVGQEEQPLVLLGAAILQAGDVADRGGYIRGELLLIVVEHLDALTFVGLAGVEMDADVVVAVTLGVVPLNYTV